MLRHNDIPARLVSGFQGGEYNEAGGFYKVRSSDAHAWVEYLEGDQWKSVDPTGFISPDRISQGGYGFLNNTLEEGESKNSFGLLRDLEQYFCICLDHRYHIIGYWYQSRANGGKWGREPG